MGDTCSHRPLMTARKRRGLFAVRNSQRLTAKSFLQSALSCFQPMRSQNRPSHGSPSQPSTFLDPTHAVRGIHQKTQNARCEARSLSLWSLSQLLHLDLDATPLPNSLFLSLSSLSTPQMRVCSFLRRKRRPRPTGAPGERQWGKATDKLPLDPGRLRRSRIRRWEST